MRLIVDMYDYCLHRIPRWNPSNICSYHLQEAGATPVQELAFALANAEALLDAIRARGCFPDDKAEQYVGCILKSSAVHETTTTHNRRANNINLVPSISRISFYVCHKQS